MRPFEFQSAGQGAGRDSTRKTAQHSGPESQRAGNDESNQGTPAANRNVSTLTHKASSALRSPQFLDSINNEASLDHAERPAHVLGRDLDVDDSSLSQARQALLTKSHFPDRGTAPAFNSVEYEPASASTQNAGKNFEVKTRLRVRPLNSKMTFKRSRVIEEFAEKYNEEINEEQQPQNQSSAYQAPYAEKTAAGPPILHNDNQLVEMYSASGESAMLDAGKRNVSKHVTLKDSSTFHDQVAARSSTNIMPENTGPPMMVASAEFGPPPGGLPADFDAILGELSEKENYALESFLKEMNMKIHTVQDQQGLTLLHHAVLKLVEGKVKLLLDFARNHQYVHEDDVIQWINQPTKGEGWTALHYASFSSNLDAIYCLIENNANIHAVNQNELTMLHVATQGDSPAAVYLFTDKLGLDINKKDKRGCTPVHWACYSCSEIALQYALALKPDINVQDKEGFTPLHLAVRSVGNIDSCRPVRSLLIKGAKTDIRDINGRIAADYISEAPEELQAELNMLLVTRGGGNPLFGGRPAVKEPTHRAANLVFFYVVFAVTFVLKFFQLLTRLEPILLIVTLVFDLLALTLHIVMSVRDPGYISNEGIEFLSLLEAFDAQSLCPECRIIRTGRSRHCIICKKCVERYDHHCPWINNCVGIRNHNLFLGYLVAQAVQLLLLFAELLFVWIKSALAGEFYQYEGSLTAQGIERVCRILYLFRRDKIWVLDKAIGFHVANAILLLTCLPFIMALLQLLYIQIGNFRKGMTTNERFGRQVYRPNMHAAGSSGIRTPFQNSSAQRMGPSASNLPALEENQYGDIRGNQFTQGSHHRSKGLETGGDEHSSSTLHAKEKYRQLMERDHFTEDSESLNSLPKLKIDKSKDFNLRSSIQKEKPFLGAFNMMANDVDYEEDLESQAIADAIDQESRGQLLEESNRRNTAFKGNQVVLTERINRLTEAQIQNGLMANQHVNTHEIDSRYVKRQKDQRRHFTVPPDRKKTRSLFCEMVREGCDGCGTATDPLAPPQLGSASYLSTNGRSEGEGLGRRRAARSQKSQRGLLEKHLIETNQKILLTKLRSGQRQVTSFYADIPHLQQVCAELSEDNNTVSRLYVQQLTDPTQDNDRFELDRRLKGPSTLTMHNQGIGSDGIRT